MTDPQTDGKGFFATLFDFSSTTFLTLKFLRVIYAVLVGLIGLSALAFFVAIAARGGASVILALVVVPVVSLLYLVLARVYLEVIALFFRIGENTSVMAAHLSGPGSGPFGAGSGGSSGPAAGPFTGAPPA